VPELPELETIRKQLDKEVVGRRVKSVDVTSMAALDRHPNKKHFVEQLEGVKLKSLNRKGPYYVFNLDSDDVLVMSVGSTGMLRKVATKDEREKHTHVSITFTQGGDLRLVDPKKKSQVFVTPADELADALPALAELGLDAVDAPVSWTDFARMVVKQSMKLKTFLTDNSIIVGLGPVYSDEVLYQAGLRYDRTTDSLSTQEIRRLYRSLVETLHDGIKYQGTTLPEVPYLDLHGRPGGFQEYLEAFGRDGEACRRCRGTISKVKFAGRNLYFCSDCQV
jgi:formamidopyrimidine-DNA glycosylase